MKVANYKFFVFIIKLSKNIIVVRKKNFLRDHAVYQESQNVPKIRSAIR